MSVELKMPSVGESITEGVIAEWFKAEGDRVELDETVCSIETDKVAVDIPSPATGVIGRLLSKEGDTVEVGQVIAEIVEGAAEAAKPDHAAPAEPADAEPSRAPAAVSPAVRRMAQEKGVDTADLRGTGSGGRVTKEDVAQAASVTTARPAATEPEAGAAPKPPQAPAPAATPPKPAPSRPARPPAPTPAATGAREEERVAMSPLRKRIAERLVAAQQTAAILTTFNEADMSAVIALRKEHQERFVARHGVKLGFMSFFVKACTEALVAFPSVNAEIDGDEIVYHHHYDIGVAIGGGRGLVVPILRSAEQMGFADIEAKIADFADRAQRNKLQLDELQGGTFTISNGGVYGSLLSTPILNPPQSGILGMHKIEKRPVVVGDQIAIRPMMYLALSYDHRLVDGREAVSFLIRVKELIENPERLLLAV